MATAVSSTLYMLLKIKLNISLKRIASESDGMSTWTLKSPANTILTFNVKIRSITSENSRMKLLIGDLFLPDAERVKSKCSNDT